MGDTRRAVILSGGCITDYGYIKSLIYPDDTVICADSGYNHAVKMGVRPYVVVGDFDSAWEIPEDVYKIQYPTKKDFTDTEIAIDYARERGYKDFLLLGATGTRLDHTLTNIALLTGFVRRGETAVIIDEHNKIMLTDSRVNISGTPGDIVSLVPLSDCYGVCTLGLEYPLDEAILRVGKGLGVSNVMVGESASISLAEGLLYIILAKD